ncbi:hypothetical protein SRABI26_02724 [Arthrobacter sp. Bi26]|uniref:hypothetical protein n=1 Tax=Arthrobacter sp. Bi26 TaxID=2822350 RepID=UPI001D98F963|nr:hypothetical protein [Arthrobacter sp. Bi26]CAH0233984.1 hypothetical protein SRABI26_02724 [Arthrobacter sp. Bi26]
MATSYATLASLRQHWAALPAGREDEATQKLFEASVEVRALYPDVDRRLMAGELDASVPELVVCRMVKRSMDAPDSQIAGVNQIQQSAGPFGQTLSFTNPDGNVYLSKSDRALLGAGRAKGKAFTIHPGGHS